jgi:hypothetical protein
MPIQRVKHAILTHAHGQQSFDAHRAEIIDSTACKEHGAVLKD